MDHESLRTASTYLNNLLLARGLLRDSEPIDFVKPSRESRAQIINLVHDLILLEDRDKEQREAAAFTIRQLRAEDARKVHDIERLSAKSADSDRAAAQAQAGERAAQTELKKVEKAMKALQGQATKLKTTLAQVKTQCTNDVRKRDQELIKLKTHLQGQQRGNRVGMTAPNMTVRRPVAEPSAHELGDPEYSLKQETTEVLTQLSQSLSDENDSLIALIRSSLSTLQELLGLPGNAKRHPDSALGSMGSEEGRQKNGSSMLHSLPTSYETLATDMESAMEHLKTILTNPNFVSVEEVEIREEEIAKVREDLEHTEDRLRGVMHMFSGWLRRMSTGDMINMEDLREGMGLVSPNRDRCDNPQDVSERSIVESDTSEIILSSAGPGANSAIFSPLRNTGSAAGGKSPKRKRDVLEPPEFFDLRPPNTGSKPSSRSQLPTSNCIRSGILEQAHDDDSEELEVPKMTIEEKLTAAQQEAELAAAARAAIREDEAPKANRLDKLPAYGLDGSVDDLAIEKDDDTLGKMPSPMGKRTKIRGRPKKRKSTLSPEELETLICADEDR